MAIVTIHKISFVGLVMIPARMSKESCFDYP